MSAFWLGVFTAVAIRSTLNAVLSLAMKGKTTTINYGTIALHTTILLVSLLAAVLTYTGVIL